MFVGVGNVTQGFSPVDSFVRLVRLDSIDVMTRKALQVTISIGLESFGSIFNGELGSRLDLPGVGTSQLVNDVIESRSKVMDTIADGQTDGKRENGLAPLYDDLLRFRIILDHHVVILCLAENFDLRYNFPKVFIGPFNPFICTSERVFHVSESTKTENTEGF